MKVLERREKNLEYLLLGSYTIGFVAGCLGGFSTEVSTTLDFSFSFESIFCILVLLPIFYWVYRYSGMLFNDQAMKIKLLYALILIIGLFFGVIFTELILG